MFIQTFQNSEAIFLEKKTWKKHTLPMLYYISSGVICGIMQWYNNLGYNMVVWIMV